MAAKRNPTTASDGRRPIIHDGDHGSDDLVATLVALGRPDALNLLGITTCHGNVPVTQASRNACIAADLAGPCCIPVLSGAEKPWRMASRMGDNAFGNDGLGGVTVPEPLTRPLCKTAHDWMVETLQHSPIPVTLCVTGPLTNIARLIEEVPELRGSIEKIVAMGGCLGPLGAQGRTGNITPFAEFNFYMDPDAADYVIRSGTPMILLPMDVTHQLVLTAARKLKTASRLIGALGDRLIPMLKSAEHLDRQKFGLDGAVIHDPHVMLYLLAPDLYCGRMARVGVNTRCDSEEHGQLFEDSRAGTPILLIDRLVNPDAAFDLMLDAISRALTSKPV